MQLVPASGRTAQVYPQYYLDQNRQSNMQTNTADTSQIPLMSDEKPNKNNLLDGAQKHMNINLFVGFVFGMILFGVPLAVFSTLHAMKIYPTSSGSSSGGSSSNVATDPPDQCYYYTINSDPTRLTTYGTCSNCPVDSDALFPTAWYRFIDGAGTKLSQTPSIINSCGASYPAYFNGTFPTTTGTTVNGTVCANVNGVLCHTSYLLDNILVTNCGSYYVFYLKRTTSSLVRYCTTH